MPTLRVVNLLDINNAHQHLVVFPRRHSQHHEETNKQAQHQQHEEEGDDDEDEQQQEEQHRHQQQHHAVTAQGSVRHLLSVAAPTKMKQDEEKTTRYHQHHQHHDQQQQQKQKRQQKFKQQEQLLEQQEGEQMLATCRIPRTPPATKNHSDDDTAASTDLIFSPNSSSCPWSPPATTTTMMLPDAITSNTTSCRSKKICKERQDNITVSKEQKEEGEEGSMLQFIIKNTDQKNDRAPALPPAPAAVTTTSKIENPSVETTTSISGNGSFNCAISIDERIIREMMTFARRALSVLMHNADINIASNDSCKNKGEQQSNPVGQQINNEHQHQQQQETHEDESLSPEQNVLAAISPESMRMEKQKKKCNWCPVCYTWNGLGSSSVKELKRGGDEMNKKETAKKKLKKNTSSTEGGLRQGTFYLKMRSKQQKQSVNQPSQSESDTMPPWHHTNGSVNTNSCLQMRNDKQQNAMPHPSSWRPPLLHANQPYHPGRQIYPGYHSEPPRPHAGWARSNYYSHRGCTPCCPPHCTKCASQRHIPSYPPPRWQHHPP